MQERYTSAQKRSRKTGEGDPLEDHETRHPWTQNPKGSGRVAAARREETGEPLFATGR